VRSAVLRAPREFHIEDIAVPEIEPTQVLVRVAACGVCASELDMWTGEAGREFPIHAGHEPSGVVERVGEEVEDVRPGDRVAVFATEYGFSEYVAVDRRFVLPAGDMPLDLALAEPVACAVNAVDLAHVRLGDDVLIVGAGFMGTLVLKLVMMQGPRHVIVADARQESLDRARSLGATHTVDVTREDLAGRVREICDRVPAGIHDAGVDPLDETGVDVAFEVTGVQAPLDVLGDAVRMSGKVVIVGYHQGGTRAIPLGQWNYKALQVVNAHFREIATIMRGMRVAMRLLTSGRLTLDDLVTHRFPLERIDEAFAVAHDKPEGFLKSTVLIGGDR
jgi:2-desacetyl-2-hydroxyethyl bacteriochlorophyllide A dehydrogenase